MINILSNRSHARFCSFIFAMILTIMPGLATTITNPPSVVALLNRVCGDGSANKFTFTLDDTFNGYNDGGKEAFQVTGAGTITANTLSALTCGLNWYLKRDCHIDICWNNLHGTLPSSLPSPSDTQKHESDSKYRYYLNYCTFSYSMSVWDWNRWQEEIDWMALHGVNLPLQIVGIDAVWYKVLSEAPFNYGLDDINKFVAGPMYQGWWQMNNLIGHGGPNPEWWYNREKKLGKQIIDRMRELGMNPILPGFIGTLPEDYLKQQNVSYWGGYWGQFPCPKIVDTTTEDGATIFTNMADKYYAAIESNFGFKPNFFGMDPFHERSDVAGQNSYSDLVSKAYNSMLAYNKDATYVAQEWETNATQYRIDALPTTHTLLLDLAAERVTYTGRFGTHDFLFCGLFNYGGNVGMHGGIQKLLTNYNMIKAYNGSQNKGVFKGIGATPEGIENNPVVFELLFELPWLSSVPTASTWLHEYAKCRYDIKDNVDIDNANICWDKLLQTGAYGTTSTSQQGCFEPIMCIRPTIFFTDGKERVSSWSNADAPDNAQMANMVVAAKALLAVNATNDNYIYDLVDIVRQVMAEKAIVLLRDMKTMKTNGQAVTETFTQRKTKFLQLIDDSDELLSYIPDFTLHQWLTRARNIAKEATENGGSYNSKDADWLEHYARMLITTWGNKNDADTRGLRDYANREWAGLLKDYYKARWVYFFDSGMPSTYDWYSNIEEPWCLGTTKAYGTYTQPVQNSNASKRERIIQMLKVQ